MRCVTGGMQHGDDVSLEVAVIGGGGMMGMRIGAEFALLGHNVFLYDRSEVCACQALTCHCIACMHTL